MSKKTKTTPPAIPLTSAELKAFKAGNQVEVKRVLSITWNATKYPHGSHIPVSHGKQRLTGIVTSFRVSEEGPRHTSTACFGLQILPANE